MRSKQQIAPFQTTLFVSCIIAINNLIPSTLSAADEAIDPQKVVIVTIHGRDGDHGGMLHLRDTLREKLAPYGVPKDHILEVAWNFNNNYQPWFDPDKVKIRDKIKSIESNPSYLALIGHSYGGWAACRVSRIMRRKPDLVALIDPVFGETNTIERDDRPTASNIVNYYQKFGIKEYNPCNPIPFTPLRPGGIGNDDVPGAKNVLIKTVKTWKGKTKKKDCGQILGKRAYRATHTNIDDNEWVWRKIHDIIVNDIEDAKRGKVSAGRTKALSASRPLHDFKIARTRDPQDIVGMGIDGENDWVFAWYSDGTVSVGTSRDLDSRRRRRKYTLPEGVTPKDIVGMGIDGENNWVFAWYSDGTVSVGNSNDLDSRRRRQKYTLPEGVTPEDIVGMGIDGENDWVFAWYSDGTVSAGSSRDLDSRRSRQKYVLPEGKTFNDVLGMGIDGGNDLTFVWMLP